MKSYTLEVAGAKPSIAMILGIAIANSSRERDGVALGIPERTSPDFIVRLGSEANAPERHDGRIVDCIPVYGSKVDKGENAIWLEKTPTDQADVNKSLVNVTGFDGYTLMAGSPKPFAAGPGTLLVRMKPNSAISFLRSDGKAFVLFANNDARLPQVISVEKYQPNMLTMDVQSTEAAGATTSR